MKAGTAHGERSASGADAKRDRESVVVFDAIGDSGRARTLVESCLATADEKTLRRLAPETLGRLLLLTRQLNAAVASPDLFRFAVTLLPTASLQRAVMEEMPRQ
jgi:hypothetical protein